MDENSLLPLSVFLIIVIVGGLYLSTDGITQTNRPHNSNEPAWIQNTENQGLDVTEYPGYGCNHGHRSFGCDEKAKESNS